MKITIISIAFMLQSFLLFAKQENTVWPPVGEPTATVYTIEKIYIFDQKGNLLKEESLNKSKIESAEVDTKHLLEKSELILEYSGSLYYMLGE